MLTGLPTKFLVGGLRFGENQFVGEGHSLFQSRPMFPIVVLVKKFWRREGRPPMLTPKELEEIAKTAMACKDHPFSCTLHSDLILEDIPTLIQHIEEQQEYIQKEVSSKFFLVRNPLETMTF